MADRPTGSMPRAKVADWRAWLLLAGIAITPPSVSTGVLSVKMDNLQEAVGQNTEANKRNTDAVNEIKISMEEAKVTNRRLSSLEEIGKDHETRIRVIEKVVK